MNRKYVVQLTEEERSQLQQLISSGTAPARKIRPLCDFLLMPVAVHQDKSI